MSEQLETIEVVNPNKKGETMIINAVDYNPAVHALPGSKPPTPPPSGEGDKK